MPNTLFGKPLIEVDTEPKVFESLEFGDDFSQYIEFRKFVSEEVEKAFKMPELENLDYE